jgi:hypothetical protein
MSGTGKSSALAEPAGQGFDVVDLLALARR